MPLPCWRWQIACRSAALWQLASSSWSLNSIMRMLSRPSSCAHLPYCTWLLLRDCFAAGQEAVVSLCRADKHACMNLRQAAIPLAATNFDRIDPEQLVLLPFADFKELLASNQLSTAEVCACISHNAQILHTREWPTASCVCSQSNCAGTLPV